MDLEHLTIRAQLSNRPVIIEAVLHACQQVGPQRAVSNGQGLDLSDPFDAEYVAAFSEIFNNIVLHGYAGGSDDEIQIKINVEGDVLIMRIIEHGSPFDPAKVPKPDLAKLPEGGLGIYIVGAFVDKFRYTPGPPNTWTLKKRYGGEDKTT